MSQHKELQLNLPDITWLWISLFILSITLCISLWLFSNDITSERQALAHQVEYTNLSNDLSNASDYLTTEVRAFVMNGASKHLQNYWVEIDKTRTREKVLDRLEYLGAPSKELALLEQAKRNSDNLVLTEIRSMKLILLVIGVPEQMMPNAVREFRLTVDDYALSDGEKVKKAREIMFDEQYYQTKLQIMNPISTFIETMQNRVSRNAQDVRYRTDWMLTLIMVLSSLILFLLISVVWIQLFMAKNAEENIAAKVNLNSDLNE
ncbi:hypothetical protein [Thalassotalea atypica]|uniref:hypothetical protein n=1 Tax=Thalassotalea atypica TaxID=2054316 RepID=UPI002573DCF7|nr:hypothetical protein [Thalassotalea atypica]